jgi:hypothetical protein
MIVDSASEVLKIPESEIETAPAMMREGGLDCVTGLGKYQGRLILLLDIGKVLEAGNRRNEPSTEKTPEKTALATPPVSAGAMGSPGTDLKPGSMDTTLGTRKITKTAAAGK